MDTSLHITAYPLLSQIPNPVLDMLSYIEDAGFEAWIVGGFVRDALRNVKPHDADIATNAHWQDVKQIALDHDCAVYETGTKHGTITVVHDDYPLEITTYRSDSEYSDHRHPNAVTFVSSITQDLARRDFTINAMAYSAEEGLIDPFGGRDDLAAHLVRAVGEPERRFEEDALRILRLYRFAARFGFAIDPPTGQAARALCAHLDCVSVERIEEELSKLLSLIHISEPTRPY